MYRITIALPTIYHTFLDVNAVSQVRTKKLFVALKPVHSAEHDNDQDG